MTMRLAKIADRLSGLGADKWAVHIEGKRRAARGEKLIFLSIGEPDSPPPAAIMDVANRQMRAGRVKYSPSQGEPEVLAALSRHYTRQMGRPIGADQFLFLPGTQTALYTAMMATLDEGDEILLPDPYYATYEGVIAAAGGIAVPVRLDPDHGFHPKVSDLEAAVTPKTRAILINTPGNPTGCVFTAGEVRAIGTMAKKHDLWIISDEVYAELIYGNNIFSSPFQHKEFEERTIIVSSLSKSHAMPGFRCGWIASSAEFCSRALSITETMLFGSQPFLEDAAAFALDNHFPELDAVKARYETRARALVEGLKKSKVVTAHLPEGGMFVMVDVRKTGLSGEEFARKLLASEGVVTMPGESFGAGGAGHVRVALTVDEAQISEACVRICRLAAQLT
jgi:arginine:pyruvate transaminase